MDLKSIRTSKGLTQVQAAQILGVSRRTYINYEIGKVKLPEVKRSFLLHTLEEYGRIDEEHGLLSIEQIKDACSRVFQEYGPAHSYLVVSYPKVKATEKIDVVLLVALPPNGIKFLG